MAQDVAPFLFDQKDIQKIIYFEDFIKQVMFLEY